MSLTYDPCRAATAGWNKLWIKFYNHMKYMDNLRWWAVRGAARKDCGAEESRLCRQTMFFQYFSI